MTIVLCAHNTQTLNKFACRIFLLMDPAHGEISRAMRNRGIEIFILPEVSVSLVICYARISLLCLSRRP